MARTRSIQRAAHGHPLQSRIQLVSCATDVGSVHMKETTEWVQSWASHVEKNPAGELFNFRLFSQGPCSLTSEHAPQVGLLGLALWVPSPPCSLPPPPPQLQPRRPAPPAALPCPSPAHAVSFLRETSIASLSSRCLVVMSCRLSWTAPAHLMPGVKSSECACALFIWQESSSRP